MNWDKEFWRETFSSISQHKLRTALTALSVWWGIFMLMILLGAGSAFENSVLDSFNKMAQNSIYLYPGTMSMEYRGKKPGTQIEFRTIESDYLKKYIDEVELVSSIASNRFSNPWTFRNKNHTFSGEGIDLNWLKLSDRTLLKGRFLNNSDFADKRKVCLIDEDAWKILDKEKTDAVLGQFISTSNTSFRIIGIYKENDRRQSSNPGKVIMPIRTYQAIQNTQDQVSEFALIIDPNAKKPESIGRKVVEFMANLHRFHPDDKQAMEVFNTQVDSKSFLMLFSAIKAFIWFVGLGSILAGVVSISNIMLIIVKDRTKEIGIRKAIGATPRSIVNMILAESLVITLSAGIFGIICGYGLIALLNKGLQNMESEITFFKNPEVSLTAVIAALIVLVTSGVAAGIYPALRASKVNPIVAMKDE